MQEFLQGRVAVDCLAEQLEHPSIVDRVVKLRSGWIAEAGPSRPHVLESVVDTQRAAQTGIQFSVACESRLESAKS
jgi:hypothetical protein